MRWFALLLTLFHAPAIAATPDPEPTVGEFIQNVERTLGKSLDLETSLAWRSRTLTERDVVRVCTAAGAPVTTTQPEAIFSRLEMDGLLSVLPGLVKPAEQPNPGTNNGRGKKKGHYKSPSEP